MKHSTLRLKKIRWKPGLSKSKIYLSMRENGIWKQNFATKTRYVEGYFVSEIVHLEELLDAQ